MKPPAGWYVFYYHDVSDDPRVPDSVRTSPKRFAREMDFLSSNFDLVPFAQGITQLGKFDRPIASICFDDGFKSVLTNALPVMERANVPHIVFLNAAFLDGTAVSDAVLANYKGLKSEALRSEMHPDRYAALISNVPLDRSNLFLDWNDLGKFSDTLSSFGSHTKNHYWLAGLKPEQQLAEIRDNENALQGIRNYRSILALPFGTDKCFDDNTLKAIDTVHGNIVVKAVGGIGHKMIDGRWIIERMGLSNEKPRIDDVIRDRVTKRNVGYRLRKLRRKISRITGV